MASIVVLDSRPVSQIVHPHSFPEITLWFNEILRTDRRVVLTEIVDYEVRRGLLRIPAPRQVTNLDDLRDIVLYSPITTDIMRDAAAVWADARRRGRPFTADDRLDGDAILIAQSRALGDRRRVVLVSENTNDFGHYVEASRWQDFTP